MKKPTVLPNYVRDTKQSNKTKPKSANLSKTFKKVLKVYQSRKFCIESLDTLNAYASFQFTKHVKSVLRLNKTRR